MSSKVTVTNTTGGNKLVWRGLKIIKSLDHICHTLELETAPGELSKVHKHDRIEVRCENTNIKDSGGARLVTTVLVDEVGASAGIKRHTVLVTGRPPAI
jgi:hypothetical protein